MRLLRFGTPVPSLATTIVGRCDSASRSRTRRRPPDFAPSSETPEGYVAQAVLEMEAGLAPNLVGRGSRKAARFTRDNRSIQFDSTGLGR